MGTASAYASVLNSIDNDVLQLLATNPEIFDFETIDDGEVNTNDFQAMGLWHLRKDVCSQFSQLEV